MPKVLVVYHMWSDRTKNGPEQSLVVIMQVPDFINFLEESRVKLQAAYRTEKDDPTLRVVVHAVTPLPD
jgi:hypothetical protein